MLRLRRGSAMRVVVVVGAMLWSGHALAQRGGGRMGGAAMDNERLEPSQTREFFEAKGLFATGLTPVFPTGIDCPGISSPFGSPTRHDGSPRNNDHHGLHNGMDITLATGTPLLAVADGEVVHMGTGGRLVGNFVWLRFDPDAIGRAGHVFARYQHLDESAPLRIGDRVVKGQIVGRSGNTGTAGGHYGTSGYPHLHFNALVADSAEFTVRTAMIVPAAYNYLDPMGLYVTEPVAPFDNQALRALPAERKRVDVSVKTTDGRIIPASGRVIWPVACAEPEEIGANGLIPAHRRP